MKLSLNQIKQAENCDKQALAVMQTHTLKALLTSSVKILHLTATHQQLLQAHSLHVFRDSSYAPPANDSEINSFQPGKNKLKKR